MTAASTVRLVLRGALGDDGPDEADPVAFLLTERGEVRGDGDMVFYGQPDHDSGAVVLAADEQGVSSALHLAPGRLPAAIAEVLLAAQLPRGAAATRHVDLVDLASGRTLGRLHLPPPGDGGLVQLGALQRGDGGAWWLQLQAEPLDRDLGDLARAAGVEVA